MPQWVAGTCGAPRLPRGHVTRGGDLVPSGGAHGQVVPTPDARAEHRNVRAIHMNRDDLAVARVAHAVDVTGRREEARHSLGVDRVAGLDEVRRFAAVVNEAVQRLFFLALVYAHDTPRHVIVDDRVLAG